MSYSTDRMKSIDRLLGWGDSVGGEVGGAHEVSYCRHVIAADLRVLGVTDAEMSQAIREGIRARRALRPTTRRST